MKNSIGKKLMASGFIVMIFILLVIAANQIVVRLFNKTSTHLVIEYHELDAIQELKFALNNLITATGNFVVFGDDLDQTQFSTLIKHAENKLDVCKNVVTERHELSLLYNFEDVISRVDSLANQIVLLKLTGDEQRAKESLAKIYLEINSGLKDVDKLLSETKLEINEYENTINTVIKHSTLTVFTLAIIIVLILGFGGLVFIRGLTRRINELVSTTIKISQGDRTAKVTMKSEDEFQTLAQSFNAMLDSLEQTTVSKDYLNNILNNMFDALVVTDRQLKIRSVNQSAMNLLEYQENELIDQEVMVLFDNTKHIHLSSTNNEERLVELSTVVNKENRFKSRTGKIIPSLISCTLLRKQDNEPDGLIIVGHDLTEKNAIERKLEQTRKERQIDINEAQEKERLRIATDLHDGMGQTLTAISYSVQNLYPKDTEVEESIQMAFANIQAQIDAAIREAKTLAHNLIPIVLKDFGLIVAMKNLIGRANETYKTRFRFDAFDFNERIDSRLEKMLYRISQESLNNIVKHAQAKNAYYQIFWQDCSVVLVIEDDGVGFDTKALQAEPKNKGIGLISMRERVLAFDGSFILNSEPGQGTEIVVEIPCLKK